MGLFDFVKNVGKKLFGASEAAAATPEVLKQELDSHGFDTSKLEIAVNGNEVSLAGEAKSQEEAERMVLAVGNTVGVSNINSSLTAANGGDEAQMYTVVKGDSLWKIAEHFYGNGSKYTQILAANMPPVENENLIQPGWVLRIPKSA